MHRDQLVQVSKYFKQYTVLVLVENTYFEGHVQHNLMQVLAVDVVALRCSVDIAA